MRRCPFCNKKAPRPLAACEYCGARLGLLDDLPAWRWLRRVVWGIPVLPAVTILVWVAAVGVWAMLLAQRAH